MSNKKIPLAELEMRGNFVQRHIGSNTQQIQEMLNELGLQSLEDIISTAFPDNIVEHDTLELYYKTDTHWNGYGANIAQYEIMLEIGNHSAHFFDFHHGSVF